MQIKSTQGTKVRQTGQPRGSFDLKLDTQGQPGFSGRVVGPKTIEISPGMVDRRGKLPVQLMVNGRAFKAELDLSSDGAAACRELAKRLETQSRGKLTGKVERVVLENGLVAGRLTVVRTPRPAPKKPEPPKEVQVGFRSDTPGMEWRVELDASRKGYKQVTLKVPQRDNLSQLKMILDGEEIPFTIPKDLTPSQLSQFMAKVLRQRGYSVVDSVKDGKVNLSIIRRGTDPHLLGSG